VTVVVIGLAFINSAELMDDFTCPDQIPVAGYFLMSRRGSGNYTSPRHSSIKIIKIYFKCILNKINELQY
jgi:hypothetical protein